MDLSELMLETGGVKRMYIWKQNRRNSDSEMNMNTFLKQFDCHKKMKLKYSSFRLDNRQKRWYLLKKIFVEANVSLNENFGFCALMYIICVILP